MSNVLLAANIEIAVAKYAEMLCVNFTRTLGANYTKTRSRKLNAKYTFLTGASRGIKQPVLSTLMFAKGGVPLNMPNNQLFDSFDGPIHKSLDRRCQIRKLYQKNIFLRGKLCLVGRYLMFEYRSFKVDCRLARRIEFSGK
jgi:hypothetical protein